MNNKILSVILSAAAVVGLASCDSFEPGQANGTGWLNTDALGVNVDGAETELPEHTGASKSRALKVSLPNGNHSRTASSLSRGNASSLSRAVVDLSDFIITVTDASGKDVEVWAYKNMPELPVFPVGDYTISVRSHNVEGAAWNAPYYEGSQRFTIVADKVTEVDPVVCTLSNIRVSVAFTDALKRAVDNLDDLNVKITSEGLTSLTFAHNESRSGYFAAVKDMATLRVDFSASVNGQSVTFTKTIDGIAKGQHRRLTFGLTGNDNLPPEELGNLIIGGDGISIDNEVVEDEPIESDYPWFEDNLDNSGRPGDEEFEDPDPVGPDDPVNPDDPKPASDITFESSTLNLDGVNMVADFGPDVKDAKVLIKSAEGFSHINVEIVSQMLTEEFLSGVGLTTKFDLAEPGQYADGIAGLNFPTPDQIVTDGITEVTFDITQFVPLIFEAGDHKFVITVVDKKGASKVLTLLLRQV